MGISGENSSQESSSDSSPGSPSHHQHHHHHHPVIGPNHEAENLLPSVVGCVRVCVCVCMRACVRLFVCLFMHACIRLFICLLMSVVDIPLHSRLPVVLEGGPAPGSLFSKLHLLVTSYPS